MKILIVEDEPKTGAYLKLGLTQAGFTVHLADDGWDGLDLALNEHYDLVLLDVMLPGIDGWEVIRRLRIENKTVPVLFLTARDEIDNRVKGLELGADDYLVKPFAFPELLARIPIATTAAHQPGHARKTFATIRRTRRRVATCTRFQVPFIACSDWGRLT